MADHATTIANYVEFLGKEDKVDDLVALFSDEATVEDPVGTDLKVGPDALREFYGTLPGAGVVGTLIGPVHVKDDQAAFLFQIEAMGTTMTPIDLMTFDAEGKITSMRAFW